MCDIYSILQVFVFIFVNDNNFFMYFFLYVGMIY